MSRKISNFFKKNTVIAVIISILLCVVVCGFVSRLTNNFTEFEPSKVFARNLNENNKLFGTYEDDVLKSSNGITYTIKNGLIKMSGKTLALNVSNPSAVATPSFEIATVTLPAGTYTFTCFDDNINSAYAVGTWSESGTTYTWKADVSNVSGTNEYGQTVTFTKSTTVTFYIHVLQGVELNNVKAMPCVVEGEEPGNFYAPIFGGNKD